MKKILIFILINISLFSYQTIEDKSELKILTYKDQKICKLKLQNELPVYLISNPQMEKSAVALAVASGSWNDPKKYPGMAHFLEHMLFQGTKKYPKRSDFFNFIIDHNGSTNAFTSSNHTVYSFSIENSSFIDGLDRFSQFFITPLFDEEVIKKELYAVNEEFCSHLDNERIREYFITKELCDPNHPIHNFCIGNAKTLSIIPRKELINWHKKHYISNNMALCILTNEPPEKIIPIIEEKFKNIPKGEKALLSLGNLFSKDKNGTITYIKPINKTQELNLFFEIPKEFIDDKTKSLDLIAYYFSSKHKNSLFDLLKKKNLITDLSASSMNYANHNMLFNISMDLTDLGISDKNTILEKCFAYIDHMKTIPKHVFDQMQAMKKNNYLYQTIDDPFQYVSSLAKDMLYEDLETFPKNTYFAENFSSEKLNSILQMITPQNCQYYIIADPLKTKIKPTKKETYLKGEYTNFLLSKKLLSHFSNQKDSFSHPPINPFIPEDLTIQNHKDLPKYLKIIDNEHATIFLIPNHQFPIPKIDWMFTFHVPKSLHDIKSETMSDFYVLSLKEKLSPLIKKANDANLYPDISHALHKIIITVFGNSDKANILFYEILKTIKNFSLTKEEFKIYIDNLNKKYCNKQSDLPVLQACEKLFSLLVQNKYTFFEKQKILKEIKYEDFISFSKDILSHSYLEAILSGNMNIKDCESLFIDIRENLSFEPFSLEKEKILTLKKGPYKIIKNTPISGSGVVLAIEEDPFSFKNLAIQEILSYGIQEPFFSSLRSDQKAAYFVKTNHMEIEKHLFQIFVIQSSFLSTEELLYRFEEFIDNFLKNIDQNIDQKRFEKIKRGLILSLKEKSKSLHDLTEKYNDLAFQKKDFDFIKKKIKALEDLSYEDFKNVSINFLSSKNKKRIAILFNGKINKNISYLEVDEKNLKEMEKYISY